MARHTQKRLHAAQRLGLLAMKFRGTRDEGEIAKIVKEYGKIVARLIESGTWDEIPPPEDQLPDELMPLAFFHYWSLPSLHPADDHHSTKPAIILEGMEDVAIVKAILPPCLVDACELQPTEGRSTLVSAARAHILQHHAPIAILFDTDTVDPTVIMETIQTTKQLVASVAGDIPFDIISFIPHIEAAFFEGSIDLQRIFPRFKKVSIQKVAKLQPKEQLRVLFEKGGGPRKLEEFLAHLTLDEVKQLQSKGPIHQLITFIKSNRDPATHIV